jgi:outer membrane protein
MKAKNRIACAAALAVAVGLIAPPAATAQTPAGPQQSGGLKIAVINGDRVLAESTIGQQVATESQAAMAEWNTRIQAKQAEIDTLVQQAQTQQLTLTQEALARIQAQVEQLNVELQRLRDDAQRAFNQLGADAQIRINEVLIPAVEQLANQEGYDLILDTRVDGILYFADAIDATDQFLVLVNAGSGSPQQQNRQ